MRRLVLMTFVVLAVSEFAPAAVDSDRFGPIISHTQDEGELPDRSLNPSLPDAAPDSVNRGRSRKKFPWWQLTGGLAFFGGVFFWSLLKRQPRKSR
ncbi:MAG: hypothetical protein V3W41_20720 [Planctomycetota bacterium]